jgi:hypothetical protein
VNRKPDSNSAFPLSPDNTKMKNPNTEIEKWGTILNVSGWIFAASQLALLLLNLWILLR